MPPKNLTRHCTEDERGVGDLIQAVLASENEEEREQLVHRLQEERDIHEVFLAARTLSCSKIPKERSLGAEVLGFLGFPDRPLIRESAEVLIQLIIDETDGDVLFYAIDALRHMEDFRSIGNIRNPNSEPVHIEDYPNIIPVILPLTHFPEADVRVAVAIALGAALLNMPGHEDKSAVQALVDLSADKDRDVRDWATFELAAETLARAEWPELTEALWQRVGDEDAEVRSEALLGLARRHTDDVLEPLIRELSWQLTQEDIIDYTFEAAYELADPRLCSVLIQFKDKWESEWLAKALDACACEASSSGGGDRQRR